jgi:hypothetical protein
MFKIRREQAQAFREEALRDFEDRVLAHAGRCFPDRTASLGEDAVRHLIRRGVERAACYGIVAERDVCMYVDLMLVFGADFDRENAWARDILATRGKDPSTTLRALYARGVEAA